MTMRRRRFIGAAFAGGAAIAASPAPFRGARRAGASSSTAEPLNPLYPKLDAVLERPVLERELFITPGSYRVEVLDAAGHPIPAPRSVMIQEGRTSSVTVDFAPSPRVWTTDTIPGRESFSSTSAAMSSLTVS